jgi:hypothetical protein
MDLGQNADGEEEAERREVAGGGSGVWAAMVPPTGFWMTPGRVG